MFYYSFPACALIVVVAVVVVVVVVPLFKPGSDHSGSRAECDRVFPNELSVSSFPDRSLHYAWTAA